MSSKSLREEKYENQRFQVRNVESRNPKKNQIPNHVNLVSPWSIKIFNLLNDRIKHQGLNK